MTARRRRPTLVLPTGAVDVPYYLGGGRLDAVPAIRAELAPGAAAFVVTDANVGPLHGEGVAAALDAPLLVLPAGEEHKRWASVERVVHWLLGCGVERRDLLVAVGGGVITDLVGFAAAVVLRGIRWIAVPTTLLGMVDAAVGGKTGIDLDLGKNLVGSFWPPAAVVADPQVLATLDSRELRAGLAEVVKAGLIAPSTLQHVIDRHLEAAVRGDLRQVADLIHASVRVKGEVVASDALEKGARASLNLGHTVGHALEAAAGYGRFLHGEAVCWGLLAVLRLARDRGLLSTADAQTWAARVGHLAPLPPISDLTWESLAPFVARDKKRAEGRVGWVLPRDGGVVMDAGVDDAEARAVYAELQRLAPEGPFTELF